LALRVGLGAESGILTQEKDENKQDDRQHVRFPLCLSNRKTVLHLSSRRDSKNLLAFPKLSHKSFLFELSQIPVVDICLAINLAGSRIVLPQLRDHRLHGLGRRIGYVPELSVKIVLSFFNALEVIDPGKLSGGLDRVFFVGLENFYGLEISAEEVENFRFVLIEKLLAAE
jgi:hypothetical protein